MTGIPILMYHNVGRAPHGAGFRELYVSVAQFKRQMYTLRMLGFRGVSMNEALPYFLEKKIEKIAVLTFDDGYADNVSNVLPVLKILGFTATCYLVSHCVGGFNKWDADAAHARKQLMNREQLHQWIAHGMEIGAHSRTHPRLTQCDARTLDEEIVGCKRDIEEMFGIAAHHFCYPYGAWDFRVAEEVRRAGYRTAVTTRRGRAKIGDDLLRLSRVKVRGYDTLPLFAMKLLTAYEDRRAYDLTSNLTGPDRVLSVNGIFEGSE